MYRYSLGFDVRLQQQENFCASFQGLCAKSSEVFITMYLFITAVTVWEITFVKKEYRRRQGLSVEDTISSDKGINSRKVFSARKDSHPEKAVDLFLNYAFPSTFLQTVFRYPQMISCYLSKLVFKQV